MKNHLHKKTFSNNKAFMVYYLTKTTNYIYIMQNDYEIIKSTMSNNIQKREISLTGNFPLQHYVREKN